MEHKKKLDSYEGHSESQGKTELQWFRMYQQRTRLGVTKQSEMISQILAAPAPASVFNPRALLDAGSFEKSDEGDSQGVSLADLVPNKLAGKATLSGGDATVKVTVVNADLKENDYIEV